jgi:hypothetical protein
VATPSSTDQLKAAPGASRRRAFLIGVVETLLFLITAAAAVAIGTWVITNPHTVYINETGPRLDVFGILAAFTAYGALSTLFEALLPRRDDANSETETQP